MPLSGPRLSPRSGNAKALVVLVHGYGADGEDLIDLAKPLSQLLPDAAFVAPNAPLPCPGAGFMWFPITDLNPAALHRGVTESAPVLQRFLADELQRQGLDPEQLILIGFSQGTMLSLHLLLEGQKAAAVAGFSGVLTGPARPLDDPPPVFLAHGTADTVIPVDALFLTAGALAASGARVQWHLTPALGHGIDEAALTLAGRFLKSALGGRFAAAGPASSFLR